MLKLVKKVLPQSVQSILRNIKQRLTLEQVYWLDKARFSKNYSKPNLARNDQAQLEARLVFHSHSLEKGLSHNELRLGFGISAISHLSKVMQTYLSKGFTKESEAYINAVSVLNAYFTQHELASFDASKMRSLFSEEIQEDINTCDSALGGILTIDRSGKEGNREKNFKSLFLGRWSVREYDQTPVEPGLIIEAIEISKKSPSVCNRQSARVTVIQNPEKIRDTLALQGGFNGYDTPPVLLVVTADAATAVGVHERNQAFIDGGLFSMSLLMSLEFVKLAACPLNAMLPLKREKELRASLEIPDNEVIIMFISVGNFIAMSKVPKSFRYSKLSREI